MIAGHAGAVVWLIASLSVIGMALALPGAQVHRHTVVAMGVGGRLWAGFSGLFLDYRQLPAWLIHLSTMAGVAAVAVAISLSGGARSPAWACLFYVVVFAAPAFIVLGFAIVVGKGFLFRVRRQAERLTAEQGAVAPRRNRGRLGRARGPLLPARRRRGGAAADRRRRGDPASHRARPGIDPRFLGAVH